MCATIMPALQILAIAPLSLCSFVPPLPCPDAPGTCPSLSISLLQSTSANKGVNDASAFALRLISILPGVVDDNYSAIWTLQEIASFAIKSDGGFLDCYRTIQSGG
ncbi:hypothetical protein ACO0LL_27860 [Undibacterium sp. TC4M20W]|uniref:hypothetical protein n=1 Tax=Undibacterium sp. TC4M20W TaxID=3413052 RepID=UPI003BF24E0E